MTTRRHPRTMTGTDAAFPHTADYASSVTRYRKPRNGDTAVTWACVLGLVFLIGLLIVEAL